MDITENNITFIDGNGKEETIESDSFIYCGDHRGNNKELEKEFKDVVPKIVGIGDGKNPKTIKEAIKDAQSFTIKI